MILALDTTGHDCGIALLWEDYFQMRIIEGGLKHNEILLSEIDRLLADNAISGAKLSAVAVSSGPGSFTGLRVGMAAAKGLCMAWKIPFITVPTLDGLAASVSSEVGRVLTLMSARATEVYWAVFEWSASKWDRLTENQLDDISILNQKIDGEVFPVGEGYIKHQTEIDRIFKNTLILNKQTIKVKPLVHSTAIIARTKFVNGQFDDIMESEPQYCYAFPRKRV